jgi:hypothetical protein
MTSRFDFLSVGDVILKGHDLSFCGEVFVYFNTPFDWSLKEFRGILTDKGDPYRGSWEDGDDFDRLVVAFMEDPRLVEVAQECIKRRLNFWRGRSA